MVILWKRSRDGFVESHCGEWRIVPLFCACTRPQDYELWRCGAVRHWKVAARMCGTQRGAKDAAEVIAKEIR